MLKNEIVIVKYINYLLKKNCYRRLYQTILKLRHKLANIFLYKFIYKSKNNL